MSFDFDNDRKLKDFIVMQARRADSPFNIIDLSLKAATPQREWETKAAKAIARSRAVLVMVGPQTYRAPGVLKKTALARQQDKKFIQIIGYKDGA
ncbi:MAG: hypothetical protein ABJF86_09100 [Tateyamaria sp.]|uniref:hypothetical protein n=1 Tax=Tateyamaria sp. TaxID=1929288 RepID=UPI00326F88CD